MKLSLCLITAATLMVVGGCASRTMAVPFNVIIRGPATSCSIEVDGRKVTMEELLAIARPEVRSGRRAHVDSDMKETPYRCLGGAIYTLQMAGFKDVGFVAELPSNKR